MFVKICGKLLSGPHVLVIKQHFFLFGSHLVMHRGYSWLCTQELFLVVLRGPYGMLEIEPGSATCKANALPAVLLFQPLLGYFCVCVLFCHTVGAQGLFLPLHSGITQGTM